MEELILPKLKFNDDEIEKLRAAYALNVCAVSVSQIVDYNDQYILDQEYENTLNNLNLEKMPKDEAFLKILSETLNVVTFFRIYNEKKNQIEKQYQDKIKDAVWSAVPNLALIVSSGGEGGLYALIASVVTEVGLGYMNYRKARSENELEYQSNLVELQYTAIEQLNAIRTELFVTSWKIADKYGFHDNYRLTENQIRQFNDIIMDSNILRRYNRLYAIRENFIAYLPFWYYLGNAANLIASSDNDVYTDEYKKYYHTVAQDAFEYYLKLTDEFSVLRNDEMVSACALEYCSLLDVNEKAKKAELIELAVKWSGCKLDVVQMCAMAYLTLEMYDKAEPLIKRLVDEQYCEELNAQVLSSIYAHHYFENQDDKVRINHLILTTQEPSVVLFQLPVKENAGKNQNELWDEFLVNQVNSLFINTNNIIDNYFDGFTYKLNKLLMTFDRTKEYNDLFFLTDGKYERIAEAERIFNRPLITADYIDSISKINYPVVLVDEFNEMLNGLQYLPFLNIDENVSKLEITIKNYSEKFEQLQECINTRNINYETYLSVFEPITFDTLVKEFVFGIKKQVEEYVKSANDMKDIIDIEVIFSKFAEKNSVKFFDHNPVSKTIKAKNWFTINASSICRTAFSVKTENDNRQRIEDYLRNKIGLLILDSGKIKVYFRGEAEFNKYFTKTGNIIAGKVTKQNLKEQAIAVIDELNGMSCDLIFTYNSVVPCYMHKLLTYVAYKFVRYDTLKNWIHIGGITYNNRYVDLLKLARCIEDIANMKEGFESPTQEERIDESVGLEVGQKEEKFIEQEDYVSKIQMVKKCQICQEYNDFKSSFCIKCGSDKLITVPGIMLNKDIGEPSIGILTEYN